MAVWTYFLYDPVTTNTYDITSQTSQCTADERIDSENNTFKLQCKNILLVHKFHTVSIYKDGVIKYGGFVITQNDEEKGTMKQTTFQCFDWSYIFNNRIVPETYVPTDAFLGRPDLIIKDLVAKHAPELTTANVDVCGTILDRMQFRYILLLEAMSKIMENIPAFHWHVDAAKDVHFYENYESDGPAFQLVAGRYNFNVNTIKVEYIGDEQVNRLWIVGNKQADSVYIDDYFTGDGTKRYFVLAYEPNFTDIYVGGVLKLSKLESNDDGAQDFLISKSERVIYIPANIVTPFTGTIKAHYRPTKQPIDYYENAPNIATYGLYEKVIKNNDIVDRLTARQYARAQVRKRSTARRIVNFDTREEVTIGERCYINIAVTDATKGNWDIVGYFLVLSVSTTIIPADEVRNVRLEEII